MINIEVGNKARSLIELTQLGLPIPGFFVIPTFFYSDFINAEEPHLSEDRRQWILSEVQKLKPGRYVVRSSSTKEDGNKLSFAGIFESYMDLQTPNEIVDAIIQCWCSVFSDRVINYSNKFNVDVRDIRMAVIVQEFIEPDLAGVLFTAHPTLGHDREMVIEACRGRGERLVSGHVTPSSYRISWGRELTLVEVKDHEGLCLNEGLIESLREWGQKIQAHYGKPQDIEFVVKDGQIFIVQSRDITRIQFSPEMGEWTTADFRDGGVSSEVVSPLMWSLYDRIFSSSLPAYFFKIKLISKRQLEEIRWYQVFYGRPYWNLKALKEVMAALPGFNEKNFDQDLSIPATYEGDGQVTPMTISGVFRALPTVFSLDKEFKQQLKRSRQILKDFRLIEQKYLCLPLEKLSDADFSVAFCHLIETDHWRLESEYFQTIYNASNAKMEFLNDFKKYKKLNSDLEYIHLISDLGDLAATRPPHDLKLLAEKYRTSGLIDSITEVLKQEGSLTPASLEKLPQDFAQDVISFSKKYYYHSERELDLRVPRWSEDFRFILSTFRSLLSGAASSNSEQLAKHKADIFHEAKEKLIRTYDRASFKWIPGVLNSTFKKLERVREFLRLREEIRDLSTRVYYFIRQFSLELARRKLSGFEDLIFYADVEEVLAFCRGELKREEFIEATRNRQLYAHGYRNYKNPNEIGARYNGAKTSVMTPTGSQLLSGIGCSAGRIRSRARVIKDISESHQLQAGEILVVRFTDPGWTPLFSLASGVVCETGGLLSHAALISREYGIPSVLNVSAATSQIQDGQVIEIDGTRGEVYLT